MNETKLTETLKTLYPEPEPSEALEGRLERMSEEADRRRERAAPVRRAARLALLAAGVTLAALAAPQAVQAVRLLDAARVLENGRGVVLQERRPGVDGALAAWRTTWATRTIQRRESGGKVALWKNGQLYSWGANPKNVLVRSGEPPLGGDAATFLRRLAWESCLDTVRLEHRVRIDEPTENGQKLRRMTLSDGGDSVQTLFDPKTALPVRLDVVAADGTLKQSDAISVEPIDPARLALPESAAVRDLDAVQSAFLVTLPRQVLTRRENLTIHDLAIGKGGDLFLLYAESVPPLEPGTIAPTIDFQISGFAPLGRVLTQRPDGLRLAVFAPAGKRQIVTERLSVNLRFPETKPFQMKEFHEVKYRSEPAELPVRKLDEDAPDYTELPLLPWDRAAHR